MDTLVSLTSAQLKEAATLKEQIETAQARLAELLGGAPATVTTSATTGKRQLSPKARKAIADGQRKRWAAVHAKEAAAATAATPAPAPVAPVAPTAVAA